MRRGDLVGRGDDWEAITTNLSARDVGGIIVAEGLRAGIALDAGVIVLGILGLSPGLAWIPEGPLFGSAIVLPVVTCGLSGYRARKRSNRAVTGMLAGSLAGTMGGAVAGVVYVLFGKSPLNIVFELLLGAVAGALVGLAGATVSRRFSPAAVPPALPRDDLLEPGDRLVSNGE